MQPKEECVIHRLTVKDLVKRRLPYLENGDWILVEGKERVVRVVSVIPSAEMIEASSFGPEGEVVNSFRFSQVLDICPKAEGLAYDRIVANSLEFRPKAQPTP
jgi:hypothetical protein